MMAEKIRIVDVMSRNTFDRLRYFWYLVAFLCIMDRVDLAEPDRLKSGILTTFFGCHFTISPKNNQINVLFQGVVTG